MTSKELGSLKPLRYCQSCCRPIGYVKVDTDTFPCRNGACDFYGVVQLGHKNAAVLQAEWQQRNPGCTRVQGSVIRDGMIRPIY